MIPYDTNLVFVLYVILYVQIVQDLHRGYFLNQKKDLGADDFKPRRQTQTHNVM